MVRVWAHRGCCTRYPENTLLAFEEACRYDIAGIELDIQLTADGELVVIHDEWVNRTTDGRGMVKDFTLEQLKALRIAGPEGWTEQIPTMAEVFDLLAPVCRERGLLINIELKNSNVPYEGMEEKILALAAEKGLSDYIVYSSFNPDSVRRIKQLDPTAQTGILASKLTDCCGLEASTQADALHCNVDYLDEDKLRYWTQAPIRAWNSAEPFYPYPPRGTPYDLAELEKHFVTDIIVNQPELYCLLYENKNKRQPLFLQAETAIDMRNGGYGTGHPARMTTLIVSRAPAGSTLTLLDRRYAFAVATYNDAVPPELIYSYSYDRDAAWVTYNRDYDEANFSQETYTFEKDCFFRVCLRRLDGKDIPTSEAARADGILRFLAPEQATAKVRRCFAYEIANTAWKVRAATGCVKLALMADSHYTTNSFWRDTVTNLTAVNHKAPLDGVVHLGDLTDGVLPARETAIMTRRCLQDLQALGKPLLVVPGNHDSAYFSGNRNPMTPEQEQDVLYKDVLPPSAVRQPDTFWYYYDVPEHNLRMLVLFSHDYRANPRYGYPDEELTWVRQTLEATPAGWRVLVFSHCPALPEMHYWSKDIRNGTKLVELLAEYRGSQANCKVLALIHGHNHCDQVDTNHGIPIVSIGCAKMEYFPDKKPDNSVTSPRLQNHVTQELWDVLLVNTKKDTLQFVRFGAGKDRTVQC